MKQAKQDTKASIIGRAIKWIEQDRKRSVGRRSEASKFSSLADEFELKGAGLAMRREVAFLRETWLERLRADTNDIVECDVALEALNRALLGKPSTKARRLVCSHQGISPLMAAANTADAWMELAQNDVRQASERRVVGEQLKNAARSKRAKKYASDIVAGALKDHEDAMERLKMWSVASAILYGTYRR
jgi:hypothetical protein